MPDKTGQQYAPEAVTRPNAASATETDSVAGGVSPLAGLDSLNGTDWPENADSIFPAQEADPAKALPAQSWSGPSDLLSNSLSSSVESSLIFRVGPQDGEFRGGIMDAGRDSDEVVLGGRAQHSTIILEADNDYPYPDNAASAGGSLNLSELIDGGVSGFEVIDLSASNANSLNIDSALSEISGGNSLMIKGDAADQVSLDMGDWSKGEAVQDSGAFFDIYTNSQGDELLIQQNILILTSN